MKIMLVDDSSTMRRIQHNVLEKLNYTEIQEAGDGREALDLLKTSIPDLIFLDWNMPIMDGLTTLKNIRVKYRDKNIKIIMCTSESEKVKVIEAVKAGADSYIIKPFTQQILGQKLKELGIG